VAGAAQERERVRAQGTVFQGKALGVAALVFRMRLMMFMGGPKRLCLCMFIKFNRTCLSTELRLRIGIDLPDLWYTLLGTDGPAAAQPKTETAIRYDLVSRTELLKNRLRSVIVHAWPRPIDPVVAALRREAIEMMDELEKLRERLLH